MREFFTRQGFDISTRVIYGGDAQGNLDLLDKDLANKQMPRKGETNRETVRRNPYTYLFWTKGKAENIIRRSGRIRDGVDEHGNPRFKKFVSIKFPLVIVFLSNKGNTIEDFEEAFAAEWQNVHNAPMSLKWAFPQESAKLAAEGIPNPDMWMNLSVIQELGESELVSYRTGNLFGYTWTAWLHLNFASEFASIILQRLKHVVVDLYNAEGIPLSSIGSRNTKLVNVSPPYDPEAGLEKRVMTSPPQDPPAVADYTASNGIVVKDVPVVSFYEKDVTP